MDQQRILNFVLAIPAFVSALTVHEFAHAWMATRLGDDTPRRLGRLTLDPLVHLDPLGFLMLAVAALMGLPLLGWAKPVPFQPRNLKNPRTDTILVAVAGPASNLLQATVWWLALFSFRLVIEHSNIPLSGSLSVPKLVLYMLITGVQLNITLAAFNMIPIPPLDGHYVLEGLGPPAVADLFRTIRPYSFILLLLLLQTSLISGMLQPFEQFSEQAVLMALGPLYQGP